MKNTLLCLMIFALLLSSCKEDDQDLIIENTVDQTTEVCVCPSKLNSKSIIGIWSSISYPSDKPLYDINKDGKNSMDLLIELPCRYSKFIINEDQSFIHESNSWKYDSTFNEYNCSNGTDLSITSGTWIANSENTMLSLKIGEHISFLYIEFDEKTLKHQITPELFPLNAQGENERMHGKVIYCRK